MEGLVTPPELPVVTTVALAIALRLAWVLLVPTRPVGDFALYLESAAHLLAHHSLDAEFIYMPGYVLLLAGVQALGGGLLAAKLVGVAAGGLGAWAVFTIALRLWDRATALVAGLLFACWPAGIAVASVTGTDMPAAALLAAAVAVLMRDEGRGRPLRAAVGFGLVLGMAAYVRAVALPLAALAFPYWVAASPTRAGVRAALARTAVGCVVAFVVLLPWGIRNQLRYGEFFVTDSHGGHTALVGANPNSEGVYSRSLNQMFWRGTGFRLFDPSPRDSDRAAYALAKSWAAFEPAYALGLVAAKADRLLTHERPLLYWPLYRESVLRDPPRGFFDRHRVGIERLVDGFWYFLCGVALTGVVCAGARRDGRALAILLFPVSLTALYATFFSEVRYHLAIAIFLFPFAAAALRALAAGARENPETRAPGARPRRHLGRPAVVVVLALALALLFAGWPAAMRAGASLRARHRWAVCVCRVDGRNSLCNWRATPTVTPAASPLRGVWDGVGLRTDGPAVSAATDVELPGGRYRVTARAERTALAGTRVRFELRGDGRVIGAGEWTGASSDASSDVSAARSPLPVDGFVEHLAGKLRLELRAEAPTGGPEIAAPGGTAVGPRGPSTVWLSDIRVEPDLR